MSCLVKNQPVSQLSLDYTEGIRLEDVEKKGGLLEWHRHRLSV